MVIYKNLDQVNLLIPESGNILSHSQAKQKQRQKQNYPKAVASLTAAESLIVTSSRWGQDSGLAHLSFSPLNYNTLGMRLPTRRPEARVQFQESLTLEREDAIVAGRFNWQWQSQEEASEAGSETAGTLRSFLLNLKWIPGKASAMCPNHTWWKPTHLGLITEAPRTYSSSGLSNSCLCIIYLMGA